MKRPAILAASIALSAAPLVAQTQKLSVHWEELTAPDFVTAIHDAQGVCVLPFGIIEKHGPHLPLGTDLINARFVSEKAAQQEYAVVFPPYFFGQIAEARQQPGTVSYSRSTQLTLLQETTDEMARNGCKKVIIVNGHGGNEDLLPYFAQSQLEKPHDYVVYVYWWSSNVPGRPQTHSNNDMHAGESETSNTLVSRPDLVHIDRANQQSGADQHRQNLPPGTYTGIWWYARFPNHYSGNGADATKALGEFDMNAWTQRRSQRNPLRKSRLHQPPTQNQFYRDAEHPLDTKQ